MENCIENLGEESNARRGRYFKALFEIMFGLGALPILKPLMAFSTLSGLVNLGSLARVRK